MVPDGIELLDVLRGDFFDRGRWRDAVSNCHLEAIGVTPFGDDLSDALPATGNQGDPAVHNACHIHFFPTSSLGGGRLIEPATPLRVVGLRRGDVQGEINVAVGSLGVRADLMRGVRDLLGESLLEARHADIEPGL